jgi:disulfide bond formation protein DsbB
MTLLRLDRPRETLALLLALAAIGIVATAWGFELIGGFIPCKLCLEQRIPYYLGAPVALAAFAADRANAPALVARLLLVALAALFAWGLAVGFYQAGAEWSFWPGPADCTAQHGLAMPTAAGDLMSALQKTVVVDCTKPQIRILGLSFAGWNVLTSSGLIVVALWAGLRTKA